MLCDLELILFNLIFDLIVSYFGRSDNFKPQVSIGINSGGKMISGNIGSASLKRLDYTIIGDMVNAAQRLQSAAAPGQIIINEACYQKVKESFNANKVGEVSLKNKANPETIYELND
ncbi:MAG: adenylate/guanylate cyclase domain-containing protein [Cyclobacteriaceae bacterium]|nr:adenylate/guanylate cyclase domain-containing protein [Cyclobacteriaceae bacterium]